MPETKIQGNIHLPSKSPEEEMILDLMRRVEALEATVKVFEKYADRYDRFFSSFDEPTQGTTLT